jgi:hypothetical protein
MGDPDNNPTISFAPDGSINDPVFLRLIEQEGRLLNPGDLLKLAPFFAQIRTYTVLADTLFASALLARIVEPPVEKGVQIPLAAGSDDYIDGAVDTYVENTPDSRREDTGDDKRYIPSWLLILAPGTNIGLLIEKIDKKFFAVAVSPDPDELTDDPDDHAKLHSRRAARRAARKTRSNPKPS